MNKLISILFFILLYVNTIQAGNVLSEKQNVKISGRVYSQNVLSITLPKPVKSVQVIVLAPDLSIIKSKTYSNSNFEVTLSQGEKYLLKFISPNLSPKIIDVDLRSVNNSDSLSYNFPDKSLILYEENKKINNDLYDYVKSYISYLKGEDEISSGNLTEEKHITDYKKENEKEKGFFGKLVDQTINLPKEIVNHTISLPKDIANLTKEVIPFNKNNTDSTTKKPIHVVKKDDVNNAKVETKESLMKNENVSESVGEIIKNTKTETKRSEKSLDEHPLYQMTKDLFAVKMADLDEAKENIELAKLKARTKEDRMLIELKEKEIIMAEKELLKAELQNQKQLKEIDEGKEKVLLAENKLKVQKIFLYASILVGVFLLGFFVVLLRSYREKQRTNKIISEQKIKVEEANEELNQINEEILAQRDEIENQKSIVDKKNKEITSSIIYAKRIQNAILPPESLINECLPHNFVFYRPKDIVAGDFYWLENIDDLVIFAVADCTGHGVPGAMVSVVCHNALNRVVREFGVYNPGQILDKVREIVVETFVKSEDSVKDGMDICLCVYNTKTKELEYSGANNSLYIVASNKNILPADEVFEQKSEHKDLNLYEIKSTKQPIGVIKGEAKEYTTHKIKIDDSIKSIYLFTDGLPDQFGGSKNRKYGYKNLRDNLLQNSSLDPLSQQIRLEKSLDDWIAMSDEKQIDDICVMGVKFN